MPNEESIFTEALGKGSVAERTAYLDAACAGDVRLRRDVEALLAAHHRAGAAPEGSPAGLGAPGDVLPTTPGVGSMIGPYKLLEQIGGGGMGVVYMAEQVHPVRRKVALKVIKPGMDSGQVIARFEAERQALTMMDHPNIARVLDAGTTAAGRPYFVMELVRGTAITDYCDHVRLGLRERLGLFVDVCRAVQHAHQKGVIHRDLKPGNVLVTLRDDRPVPKVIDFGIAKATGQVLTDRTLFTNPAQVLGTPLYMSPEQAQLSGIDVDTRSDVYSLGGVLYELLTGTTPFDKRRMGEAGYDEMRRIIREEDPPAPGARVAALGDRLAGVAACRRTDARKLPRLLRGELDWIVTKALEKERARRYETANGLAKDVERFLDGETVLASPPSARYRLRKFAGRYRAALAVVGVIVATLVVAVVVTARQAVRAGRAESAAVRDRTAAVEAKRLALEAGARESVLRAVAESRGETLRHNLYLSEMNLGGRAALLPGGLGGVGRILAPWQHSQPDLRDWEWYYLSALCHRDLVTIPAHSGIAFCVAWSPDGGRLASAGMDRRVRVWDAATGAPLRTFDGHTDQVLGVAWSPDGTRLASCGADRTVRVWNAFDGRELARFSGGAKEVRCVTWCPDSARVAAGCGDGVLRVWDLRERDGSNVREFRPHATVSGYGIWCVAWSPDGGRIVSSRSSDPVRIVDATTGRVVTTLGGQAGTVRGVAWSADGSRVASASYDETVRLWDARSGAELAKLTGHEGRVFSVAWHPDGTRVASAGYGDRTVRVWTPSADDRAPDANGIGRMLVLRGHAAPVHFVAWSPDGTRLASAAVDGSVKIWEWARGPETAVLRGHSGAVSALAWSPDGGRLVTGSENRELVLWEPARSLRLVRTERSRTPILRLAWSPDGTRLAVGGRPDARIRWLDGSREDVVCPQGLANARAVAWSADGSSLATGGYRTDDRNTIKIRDGRTGEERWSIPLKAGFVEELAWSPDGRRLAAACYWGGNDDPVKVWDAHGTLLASAGDRADRLATIGWSRDGSRLAWAGDKGTVTVWDVDRRETACVFRGHTSPVVAVAWSPDGTRVASAAGIASGGGAKIFDPATGRETLSLPSGLAPIGWSPDGTRLAAVGPDNTVVIHDATLGYAADRSPKALVALDQRLSSEPNGARLLRLRANVNAALGLWERAGADARRFLSLEESRTVRFFQTGWWVVGPYPEDLPHDEPARWEQDPSHPVSAGSSGANGAAHELRWQSVPEDGGGPLDVGAWFPDAPKSSVYAMTRVYSPSRQETTIPLGGRRPGRVWMNGTTNDAVSIVTGGRATAYEVSVILDAGWNTLMLRGELGRDSQGR